MYKQIIGLTLLAITAVSYANVTGWTNCGSTAIINRIVAGACTVAPCHFARNGTYVIELHATATAPSSSLPFNVTADILGLPWVIMDGNACDQLTCPTIAGVDFSFSYTYTVEPIFPPVPTTVRTVVLNQINVQVICFTLPIQIT